MDMNKDKCELFILVARTDIAFLPYTIPHLVRSCQGQVSKRTILIDTSEIKGYFAKKRKLASIEQLRAECRKFKEKNLVDEIIELKYDRKEMNKLYRKHFGMNLRETHCFRGYPYYGSIWPIENGSTDYFLHFDSDMLIHQAGASSWIKEAIDLMEKHEDMLCVLPLSGPPAARRTLYQGRATYTFDLEGFYRFKEDFTSRLYLLSRKRFQELLPMKLQWLSWRESLKSNIFGKGNLLCWEVTVNKALKESKYYRVDLASQTAWSLHPHDRGDKFIKILPALINLVEKGIFPPEQAGHYDLNLELWSNLLEQNKRGDAGHGNDS